MMILHLFTLGQGSTFIELQVVEKSIRSMTTDAIIFFQHLLHYRGAIMHRDVDAVQRERESQTDRKEKWEDDLEAVNMKCRKNQDVYEVKC